MKIKRKKIIDHPNGVTKIEEESETRPGFKKKTEIVKQSFSSNNLKGFDNNFIL